MAITGTGTQADPWIVTTYAELVEKADDEGYIKIGSDINITDEYPDGDMPTLEIVKSDIDGDGKIISNWYKTDSGYCINTTDSSDTTSQIHDLTIRNIIIKDNTDSFCKRAEDNNNRPFFVNCNISGVSYVSLTNNSSSTLRFKNCSLNCDLKDQKPFGSNSGIFDSCYVIMKSTVSGGFFMDILGKCANDSYFELNLPNITRLDAYAMGFENCVLDVTSNAQFDVGGGSSDVSIINTTHAPRCTPDGTNVKGVDDAHWLDLQTLIDLGFNVG